MFYDYDDKDPSVGGGGGHGRVVQSHLTGTVVSKLRQFPSFACLSEETLKVSGPFYLVSMPGEIKDPTQGVNV